VDISATRTVDDTSDRSVPSATAFAPISQPPREPRRGWSISGEWASAIVAAIVVIAGAFLYIAGMKTDIAVSGAKIEALQKSHDTWTTMFRDEFRKVEAVVEGKLTKLSEMMHSHAEPQRTRPK
jgi:hypothetical protein